MMGLHKQLSFLGVGQVLMRLCVVGADHTSGRQVESAPRIWKQVLSHSEGKQAGGVWGNSLAIASDLSGTQF